MEMLNALMLMAAVGDYTPINIIQNILVILMVLLSIAVIVVVLMQKGTSDNIGVIGGETDSYMGKNKGPNKERTLKIVTAILGAIIVVLAIVYFVLAII